MIDLLYPRTVPLVVNVFEVFPLALHFGVVFEIKVCLSILVPEFLVDGDHVCHDKCIDTFPLILGPYGDEQQVGVDLVLHIECPCQRDVTPEVTGAMCSLQLPVR